MPRVPVGLVSPTDPEEGAFRNLYVSMSSAQVLLMAVTGNSFILLGVLIVFVFALAFGLFKVKGSGISRTPTGKGEGNAGAVGPTEESAKDQGQGSATGSDTYGTSNPQHGTK